MLKVLFHAISLLCVALGQPAFFPWLAPLAATAAFAVHWKCLAGYCLKTIGRVSFLWFFAIQMIQMSWMANLQYQGVYILVLYVLLCAAVAWQFAFTTKTLYRSLQPGWLSICALASLWALLEWVRLYVLCGFAFNFVGVSLSWNPLSLQMASLFGVLGLSFWVFLTNLSLYRCLKSPSFSRVGLWLCLAVFPYLYGFFQIGYHEKEMNQLGSHRVLLVQPSLLPSQKYCIKGREDDFVSPLDQWKNILASIALHQEREIDLIVLPEAAVPFGLDLLIYDLEEIQELCRGYFGEKVRFPPSIAPFVHGSRASNAYLLQTLSSTLGARLLAGLDYQDEVGAYYNSAFYFEPEMVPLKRYDKRVLLPLAESMPFSFLTSLSRYYGIKDFFTPGSKALVFSDSLSLSPSICYEELFPSLIREGRKLGAELFVNLTNDGWYPSSLLPFQHYTQGLIRSVENGVPLVRACNTGVTAAVDSLGRVVGMLKDSSGNVEAVSGCLWVEVPKKTHKTLFSLWGEKPLIVGSFCFVLVGLGRTFRKRRLLSVRFLKRKQLETGGTSNGNSS